MIAAQHKLTPEGVGSKKMALTEETAVFPGQRLRIPSAKSIPPATQANGPMFASAVSHLSRWRPSQSIDNLLDGEPTGKFGEQNLHFAPYEDGFVALVGLDAFANAGVYDIRALGGAGKRPWRPFTQDVTRRIS